MSALGTATRTPGNTALTFLGGAGTVTGSKYLVQTPRCATPC